MSGYEFITTLFYFLVLGVSLTSIGSFFKKSSKLLKYSFEDYGISFMIGVGLFTYISLIFGLLGLFNKSVLIITLSFLTILSLKRTLIICRRLLILFKDLGIILFKDWVSFGFVIMSLLIISSLYLSALQPPAASDELHYHMPQVKYILESKKIDLFFGGHFFYGNIPKLIEIVFAWSASLVGYSMSHLMNFAIFLSFLTVVFGIIFRRYGIKAAALSVLLLLTYDDLTWNATTGFIDSATLSFELSSLLILVDILTSKGREVLLKLSLFTSGCLMGLALASKYSPIPTLSFMFILILYFLWSKKGLSIKNIINNLGVFSLGVFIFGSFWYLKNVFNYTNPFYPLYFGHQGIDELTYNSLVEAIQQFGPKTLKHFFYLIGYFKTINGIAVYTSLFLAGLMIFSKSKFDRVLTIFYIIFTAYWFIVATHQIRFLATGIVVAMIMSAVLITKLNQLILKFVVVICFIGLYLNVNNWNSFWSTKLHTIDRQYGLGNISKSEFLTRNFGCQYKIIEYLERNNLKGNVIDNWSVWHAPSVSFYSNNNRFLIYGGVENILSSKLLNDLTENNIKYIYFDTVVKVNHLKNSDPLVVKAKMQKLPIETYLLKYSTLEYSIDSCQLYSIDFESFDNELITL